MGGDPPKILAIETSGAAGSVAVALGGEFRGEAELSGAARHAADLFPAIDRLWRDQGWRPEQVGHCYVSVGPGSFTGLRVSVTAARLLALAAGARIVAVPTLDVIAEAGRTAVEPGEHLAVLLDAKRRQVFGAVYRRDGDSMIALGPLELCDPAALLAAAPRPCRVTGEGIRYHPAAVEESGLPALDEALRWPRARWVHKLGWSAALRNEFAAGPDLTPLYVRRPEAEEIWERKHASRHAAN
jgi:tRNA threonylcarbamoyladenosine biosynthesis protein TsaB